MGPIISRNHIWNSHRKLTTTQMERNSKKCKSYYMASNYVIHSAFSKTATVLSTCQVVTFQSSSKGISVKRERFMNK